MSKATHKQVTARKSKPCVAAGARSRRSDVAGLPEGWEVKCLGDLGEFSKGKGITKEDLRHTGVPCVRYGDIYTKHNYVVRGFSSYIDKETAEHCRIINCNSLLFAGSGEAVEEIGKCVAFNMKNTEAYAGGDVIILKIDTADKAEYISYFLNSIGRKQVNRLGEGNTIVHIYSRYLQNVKVSLPPLAEQKAIADTLSLWDEAIEIIERLITAKQVCFDGFHIKAISMAKGKRTAKYKDVLSESRVVDAANDPRKRLTVRLHLRGVTAREYRGTESDKGSQFFIRKSGQLIYGKQNVFRGSIGIVPPALDGYSSSQDIPAFDVGKDADVEWLYWYMARQPYYKSLENYAAGSGSKRFHPKALYELKLELPPISEQKRIANILAIKQQEINLLKQLALKYKVQKSCLMQNLLTGEWCISRASINDIRQGGRR